MAVLQSVVVIVLVAASLILSCWWLTPARRRLWVLDHLVRADATRGPLVRLRRALLARSCVGFDFALPPRAPGARAARLSCLQREP